MEGMKEDYDERRTKVEKYIKKNFQKHCDNTHIIRSLFLFTDLSELIMMYCGDSKELKILKEIFEDYSKDDMCLKSTKIYPFSLKKENSSIIFSQFTINLMDHIRESFKIRGSIEQLGSTGSSSSEWLYNELFTFDQGNKCEKMTMKNFFKSHDEFYKFCKVPVNFDIPLTDILAQDIQPDKRCDCSFPSYYVGFIDYDASKNFEIGFNVHNPEDILYIYLLNHYIYKLNSFHIYFDEGKSLSRISCYKKNEQWVNLDNQCSIDDEIVLSLLSIGNASFHLFYKIINLPYMVD